jgi:nitrogenase molybdenum-iron protein beta chain
MEKFIERPRAACALSGALAAISVLPDTVAIIHSALGCGGGLGMSTAFGAGYLGAGYCSGLSSPSSAITEKEIIFGGTDRLSEQIKSTLELIDARLYVVATSCMTEMIGDDVFGTVSEFENKEKAVIAINTPSFKGNSYAGYEILIDGIFNRYLISSSQKDEKLINLFGIIPAYDPFFRGDLAEIARLLNALGFKVNTFFTPDQTFDNIQSAPSAALNIVFSHVYAASFAEKFRDKHQTPFWISDLPIGAQATDRFLHTFAEKTQLPSALVEALIERENREYYGYFARIADLMGDGDMKYYAVVASNANYAIPAASFLQNELGWVVLESFVTDQLSNTQKKNLECAFSGSGINSELIWETDTTQIAKTVVRKLPENQGQRYYDDYTPLYIIGSSLEKSLAAKRGAAQLSISYPVYNRVILDRGYAGYRGGLHLLEDLIDILVAPR